MLDVVACHLLTVLAVGRDDEELIRVAETATAAGNRGHEREARGAP